MLKKTTKQRIRYFTGLLKKFNINTKAVRYHIASWKPHWKSEQRIRFMIYGLAMAKENPHFFN